MLSLIIGVIVVKEQDTLALIIRSKKIDNTSLASRMWCKQFRSVYSTLLNSMFNDT